MYSALIRMSYSKFPTHEYNVLEEARIVYEKNICKDNFYLHVAIRKIQNTRLSWN